MSHTTNHTHAQLLSAYEKLCSDAVIVMSPPAYLGIQPPNEDGKHGNDKEEQFYQDYIANPAEFVEKAHTQWETAKNIYENKLGKTVKTLPSSRGLSDQTFTADPVLSLKDDASGTVLLLKSNFTHASRQKETFPFLAQAWHKAFPTHSIDMKLMENKFEGTGDCYYDVARDVFWAGYTATPDSNDPTKGRSSINAHHELERKTGIPVISLAQNEAEGCFHIDTCLAPLPTGHILVYKDGLTDAAYDTLIENAFIQYNLDPNEYAIPVSKNDAKNNFATNLLCVGKTLIIPEFGEDVAPLNPLLLDRLNDIGYDIEVIPYGQFIKVGGAVHCTSQLIQPRAHGGLLDQVAHAPAVTSNTLNNNQPADTNTANDNNASGLQFMPALSL